MIRAHQPGSLPIDVPETIPNPAVPETTPAPTKPIPQEPVKTPEKVPANLCLSLPNVLRANQFDGPRLDQHSAKAECIGAAVVGVGIAPQQCPHLRGAR